MSKDCLATRKTPVPRFATLSATKALAPWMMVTTPMSVATPMVRPRTVRNVRRRALRKDSNASARLIPKPDMAAEVATFIVAGLPTPLGKSRQQRLHANDHHFDRDGRQDHSHDARHDDPHLH